jgi:dTDP-4-amino-4,6-dideoxygalactose transaminase
VIASGLRELLVDACPLIAPAPVSDDGDHVYHQFVIRTPRRDAVRDFLARQGIATAIHYPIPIHRSEAYGAAGASGDVAPCATRLAREILSLPIFPSMTPSQVRRVGEALCECVSHVHEPIAERSS